jgi:ABC-type antimicrobial peptide transport system permease subunit
MTLAVRTGVEPVSVLKAVRDLVKSLDANVPIFQVRTIEEQFSSSLGYQRIATALLNGFSVLALLLVALGLYGVLAYSVSLRTREIGVRLALGAQIPDVLRLVLRQGLRLVVFGFVLGLFGAFAGTRLIRSELYGIDPLDPLVFGAVTALFAIIAALACWLPAHRATKVDPMVALRAE